MYLFSACVVATLLWHPASPIRNYLPGDAIRRMLMGVAMGATIMAIVLSPWGKQSGAHFNPAVTFTFYRLGKVTPCDALFYCTAQLLGAPAGVALASLLLSGRPRTPGRPFCGDSPGHLWRRCSLRRRTGHLVPVDERNPVRDQSPGARPLYTLLCRHLGGRIHRFRIAPIRHEYKSQAGHSARPSTADTGTRFGSISQHRPLACSWRPRRFSGFVTAKGRIARSCITTTTSVASSANRDQGLTATNKEHAHYA